MNAADTLSTASPAWRIMPQGDRCLIIRFGDAIDARIGQYCLGAAHMLRTARLAGVTDVVPSFVAVALHYQPDGYGNGPTYAQLTAQVEQLLRQGITPIQTSGREIEVPVCYGGIHGPDLEEVARYAGLDTAAVIALHSQPGSMVYMLGFAPGHAYIGIHDVRLNMPRRTSPRTVVPAGSVAIANRQTSIYPDRLPGGWNIIGATPLRLFDPQRVPAALLQPGDALRFTPISPAEFKQWQETRS